MTLQSKKLLVVCFAVLAMILVASVAFSESTSKGSTDSLPIENKNIASLPKIKVGGDLPNFDTVPLILAYEKGYFQDQGIQIELVQVQNSYAPAAIVGGKANIIIIGASRLYSLIEKGAPIKILAPMSNSAWELFVRPDSGINTFKDIEGKTVSYGNTGGTKELLLRYILTKENVNITKINFIDIDSQYLHIALMKQKTIDATLFQGAGYLDVAKKLGAIVLPEWQEKNYKKYPTSMTITINTDFLNKNEENVRRFFKALIEANRFLKEHLDESAVSMTDYLRKNTENAIDLKPEEFKNLVNEGKIAYSLWEDTTLNVEMARIGYELGKTEQLLTIDKLYDLRFRSLLEQAQNEIYE